MFVGVGRWCLLAPGVGVCWRLLVLVDVDVCWHLVFIGVWSQAFVLTLRGGGSSVGGTDSTVV